VEYTKTNIFDPLEMRETSYHPDEDWDHRIPKVYDESDQLDPWWNNRDLRAIGLAGGGLFTTLKDLSAFAQSFLNEGEPILSKKSCNEMLKLQTAGLFNIEGQPQTWGLGWYLNQDGGTGFGPLSNRAFGHGGATGTWICIDPEQELIVVKLANRLGVTLEDSVKMQSQLLAELL
jgi:CubicO group peptidase (beta-lactamase class C family)